MQIIPSVAHTSFLSLNIVRFNNCLTLTCQENVSLTSSQMQKRCSQGSTHLLSAMWLSFSDHIRKCRRHCTGYFFKSSICLKLRKDLEINLLKMMSSKKDSTKVSRLHAHWKSGLKILQNSVFAHGWKAN